MTIENITDRIAAFAHRTTWNEIPQEVRHEAKRSLLNYIACAIAGSREPTVEKLYRVHAPFSGKPGCQLIARSERSDLLLATLVNAAGANVFDYDDTHQNTIIHPTAPIAPALFAHAEIYKTDGRDLLKAFIVGGEIECRIGNAMSPSHYTRGWHITSTCGIFGAAVGIGMLCNLTPLQLRWAIGNASAQSAGLVETLGTMSKSISVGSAARGGVLSALLAQQDFSGPDDPLTGPKGFLRVFSNELSSNKLTEDLGTQWEIAKNTYKPYPAGIVLHPVIDACLQLHHEHNVRSEDVASVELTGHPLLQQRTNRPDADSGRLSQVSAQHAVAIVFRRGRAGLGEFDDAAVHETQSDGIRPTLTFIDDPRLDVEAVRMKVSTKSGPVYSISVAAAKGGPQKPMTDAALEDKLEELAEFAEFKCDTKAICDAVWKLDDAADAAAVMKLLERSCKL